MDKKSKKKDVHIYFIIPEGCEEDDVDDCMKMAFQECSEANLLVKWLTVEECAHIPLTKNTVFVLQEFTGNIFTKLASTKSVVCGPMCLRSCINEGLAIPENKSPVYTTAMRDLVVTASQVSPEIKADIKKKVGLMGGVYLNNLVESVTHLVTNAVRSTKYEIAGERGIPAMTVEWVHAIWEESQKRNIKATDPEIIARYKCPIFYNMYISCSNLPKKEKERMRDLINQNGGTYTDQLRQRETTLLVIKEPRGEKYKHARSWDLPCVMPSYITECVRRGYAVPSQGHLISPTVLCSTPTKEDDIANFTCTSDASVSVINFESSKTAIDDTQMTVCTTVSSQQRNTTKRPSGAQYVQILQDLNMSEAKKSGSFVDGCKVFLSGFSVVEGEKLRRILSLGGATVFSELSDSVSHVLIGEFVVNDMRVLTALAQRPHVVSLEWLAASIKQRSPANEEPFYCLETRSMIPEPPSPLSQKGMQLLKPSNEDPTETSKMPPPSEPPVNRKLFSEFLKENARSPAKQPVEHQQTLNSTTSSENITISEIFTGLKFLIAGFTEPVTADIEEAVQAAGGCVVSTNFTGVADYAVVPLQATFLNITAMEVVTNLWLEDCLDNGQLVAINYYHQPFSVDSYKKPLAGCCISLSNYFGKEKAFLAELIVVMGASYQDVFARVTKEDKGISASTHLLCPKPEGLKYNASVKWNLPALTKDWLLACARLGTKVTETAYEVSEIKDATSVVEPQSTLTTPSARKYMPPNTIGATMTPSVIRPTKRLSYPSSAVETPTTAFAHPTVSSLKRRSTLNTSEDLSPFHMSTPESPYGQVFGTPTASSKKRWKRWIDSFPSRPAPSPPPQKQRRPSTPLSEILKQVWEDAIEASSTENSNYSIENMDDDHEEASANQDKQQKLLEGLNKLSRDEEKTSTPVSIRRGSKSALGLTPQPSKNCENVQPRKISSGKTTPSTSDFKCTHTNDTSSTHSKPTNPVETPQSAKKSPTNEIVYNKMLGKLQERLSTHRSEAEETQLLPQRELVNPTEQPNLCQKLVVTAPIPESQPNHIRWEDPDECTEKAKEITSPHPSSVSPRTIPRKFVLSNVDERDTYEKLLKSLGETVISGTEYDMETTHLIVDEPIRSEKLLCCLAAGKWILHTSFIDRMVKMKKYVPEEEKFEWGNPQSAGSLPNIQSSIIVHQLANAVIRWRTQLSAGTDVGAFSNMRAVLLVSEKKVESYTRLIKAGGGKILPATSILEASHCFVDNNQLSTIPVPLTELVAHKVPCLPSIYLCEILTKFPVPSVQDSVIPEYSKLLQQEANKNRIL